MNKQRLDFDQIKSLVSFVNVIEIFTPIPANAYRTSAEGLRGPCPFCDHKDTFNINTSINVCSCKNASCDFNGGSPVQFLSKILKVKEPEAAQKLREMLGEVPQEILNKATIKQATPAPEQKNSPETLEMVKKIYNDSKPCNGHPYLKRKKIEPCPGLKRGSDNQGNDSVVVPFNNVDGKLITLQSINDQGKFFFAGAKQEDAFFCTNDLSTASAVYLAEGLATAITIWMAFGKQIPAVAFGSVQRMGKIARAITKKYPTIKIIVCLEVGKASLEQAKKIKGMPNVSFRMPNFDGMESEAGKPTDFNDILSKCNQPLGVVAKQLEREYMVENKEHIMPAQKIESVEVVKKSNEAEWLSPQFLSDKKINFCTEEAPLMPALLSLPHHGDIRLFLPKGIVGMLAGAGGVGKTHLLTQLAVSVASGDPFLRKYSVSNKGNVFIAFGENSEGDTHRLIRKTYKKNYPSTEMQADKADLCNRLVAYSVSGINASLIDKNNNQTTFCKNLYKWLVDNEPANGWDLIILDPISRFAGPNAEIDNAAATQLIALLEKLSSDLKGHPCVLFGHHMNKSGLNSEETNQSAARGSSGLTDGVRWQANLEAVQDGDSSKVTMRVVKTNFTVKPEAEILTRDGFGSLVIEGSVKNDGTKENEEKETESEQQNTFFGSRKQNLKTTWKPKKG